MKASDYIQKLFVMFPLCQSGNSFLEDYDVACDGSYGNECAVGGTLLFLIIVAVLYWVMRRQQKNHILEIDQMNAEVLDGPYRYCGCQS